jgi:aminoglycoside phosphotransferase (APT) family kinase protein
MVQGTGASGAQKGPSMPGLTSPPDAVTVACIARAASIEANEVRPLPGGTSSRAWRIEAGTGLFILRHALPDAERPPIYEAETGLFTRLRVLDVRVPERIATNYDVDVDGVGRLAWAIDRELPGAPVVPGSMTAEAARDLGELLARLHSLPVERQGALEDTREAIRGTTDDFESAAVSRWASAWPFDGAALIAHPVARRAPDLLERIGALRATLMRFTTVHRTAVLHADLHEEHIFLDGDRLGGVVDFGDAFISHPAWDIASFGYFHGPDLVAPLLKGYTDRRLEREIIEAEAALLELVIALHKLYRAERKETAWREVALQRLRAAVERAERIARSERA